MRDGATCLSSITPGFSGYAPLSPILVTGVNARGHAFPKSDAMTSVVMTRPGC